MVHVASAAGNNDLQEAEAMRLETIATLEAELKHASEQRAKEADRQPTMLHVVIVCDFSVRLAGAPQHVERETHEKPS